MIDLIKIDHTPSFKIYFHLYIEQVLLEEMFQTLELYPQSLATKAMF